MIVLTAHCAQIPLDLTCVHVAKGIPGMAIRLALVGMIIIKCNVVRISLQRFTLERVASTMSSQ